MLKEFFMLMLVSLMLIIFIMIGVAFFTLLECKILGYIHLRKGPNSVGIIGILQPFSDAIKLFYKELMNPLVSNYLLYLSCIFFIFIFNFMNINTLYKSFIYFFRVY